MPTLHYGYAVCEGSAYEVGAQRARLSKDIPGFVEFMTMQPPQMPVLPQEEMERRLALIQKHCPDMAEELRGFADELHVPVLSLNHLRFGVNAPAQGGCSVVAVLPERSTDGKLHIARSYEYSLDDETCYSVTRIPGHHTHAGFSLFQMGRFDGLNDQGLFVAISSCECVHSSMNEGEGLAFWLVVRRLLDACATVKEALEEIRSIPIGDNVCYMLADKGGDAAVVETLTTPAGTVKAVRRAENGILFCMNHYIAPETRALQPVKRRFSTMREELLRTTFAGDTKIAPAQLETLLLTRMPNGLCCHAYTDWFGTLHAMLVNVTDGTMRVCMGASDQGRWFAADQSEKPELHFEQIHVDEVAADPSFWQEA